MIYGERIKQVREMHRMTQADLANEVPSLTQSRLSRIEKDLAPVDDESLALIASVTGVNPGFFARPPRPTLQALSPQLRARSRLTQGEKAAALQWARLVDEEYQNLRAKSRVLPMRMDVRHGEPVEQAAARARQMLGFTPEQPLPYLILALERLGVTVLGLPYAVESLDAFCLWRDGEPVIAVLKSVPADRVRFSIAHELGHLLLHQTGQTGQEVEAEAERFAAELLTPISAMRSAMPRNPTLSALTMLKTTWGVSVKSLIRRAREIGAVDGERATSLYKQISARGWNKKEPGFVPLEKPRALRKMAELAYGPAIRTQQLASGAGWSEHLALDVLAQHASSDELPFEPLAASATDAIASTSRTTARRPLGHTESNVIPFRTRVG
ncbi:ImmA/IrrE family metallo-endopeptidase [Micromonospora chalcea]|uniref:XRE family transcriptional regulator n=1 Tax=Micromonospora chalcea TaxID=1874 RepID=UPI0016573B05|nr:XRE family transcriptional regulator [Micromonospora chalcea]MBC8991467.1 ImmA/IrrE family metallo-endopeptidase [Micromonospora chalcea]